jgi:ElaB/YqjD/DUF883 family membrane-anchored ribosome-binding protein
MGKTEEIIKEGIRNYREGKTKKFKTTKEAINYLDDYVKDR